MLNPVRESIVALLRLAQEVENVVSQKFKGKVCFVGFTVVCCYVHLKGGFVSAQKGWHSGHDCRARGILQASELT